MHASRKTDSSPSLDPFTGRIGKYLDENSSIIETWPDTRNVPKPGLSDLWPGMGIGSKLSKSGRMTKLNQFLAKRIRYCRRSGTGF